jgi:hypothetical protein
MNPQKKNYALLLLSAVGIVVISLLSSHIVPLYDGVGFPDEPYRYVNPPVTSKKTLPPSPAETVATISHGTNLDYLSLASREQGPQSSFYVYHKVLKVNPGLKTISLKAIPMAPDSNKPSAGQIAGNFYRFTVTEPKTEVTFSSSKGLIGYVDLRLPQSFPVGATIVYRNNSSSKWHRIKQIRFHLFYFVYFGGRSSYTIRNFVCA